MNEKYIYLFFLIPSFLINYFTLSLFDSDHNLSSFSTILVSLFNILNFITAFVFIKYNLKKFIILIINILIILIVADFTFQSYLKKKSYQVQDKKLGWILNKSIKKNFIAESKKGRKYQINYSSSDEFGFRYIDNNSKFDKTILIIGDSFTVGPYASDNEMYFSWIKKIFNENNLNYNWYVMGSAGWGTFQQYLYLKEKINYIKPDILIHQFCSMNDFINNSIEMEQKTYLRSQYIFRPYLVNNNIYYKNNLLHKTYKFLYSNSYIFKTIDNLITNKQYRKKNNYFKKEYSKNEFARSILITENLIKKIKNLLGNNKLYFLVDCYDKKNPYNIELKKIISKNNIYSSDEPILVLKKAEENFQDILVADGGHLNDLGNKIYGSKIASEILKIIQQTLK